MALPLGELSPKVTERALHSYLPSPSSLRSVTSPIGRGKGYSHSMIQGQAQQIILLCLLTVLCPRPFTRRFFLYYFLIKIFDFNQEGIA